MRVRSRVVVHTYKGSSARRLTLHARLWRARFLQPAVTFFGKIARRSTFRTPGAGGTIAISHFARRAGQ